MIRDLEADGSMGKAASMGSGELSLFMSVINMQTEIKSLRDQVARHTEVMAGLAAKVRALEGIQQPVEVKGQWTTTGAAQ